jgi:serine/threonine protein phosphatase PrpC
MSTKSIQTFKATFNGTFFDSSSNVNTVSAIQYAVSSMQGRRPSQEDAHVIETELFDTTPSGHALFGIFDGHGTSFASNYVAEHFVSVLRSQASFVEYKQQFAIAGTCIGKQKGKATTKANRPSNDADGSLRILLEDAIKSTTLQLDANLLQEMNARRKRNNEVGTANNDKGLYDDFDSGTTAIIVLLTPHFVICANLGDSRSILHCEPSDENNVNTTNVVCLSRDHKPNDLSEKKRVEKAGGVVLGGMIEGRLAVSRGLGDFAFKHTDSLVFAVDQHLDKHPDSFVQPQDQMVSSVPEVTIVERDIRRHRFLVIACDGIWDVTSNEKCAQLLSDVFDDGEGNVGLVCEELLDTCYTKGSLDNMTVILLKFPSQKIGDGGGVMNRRKQRIRR